jgi:phosphoadenosine phosphosulfate reductase
MSVATEVRPAGALEPLVGEGRALVEAAGSDVLAQARVALVWAAHRFGEQVVLTSSMSDAVLVHVASTAVPGIGVLFLDTGYHFPETLGMRDAVASVYDVDVRTVLPLRPVAEQDREHGPDLWRRDPDLCCALRKVEPLERGLAPFEAWISGLRREDAPTREQVPVVDWDARRAKVKINPLAHWTQDDVDAYISAHGLLVNPLQQVGYRSIGCAPCTRPVSDGEDPRAGRWAGLAKTECGIHA